MRRGDRWPLAVGRSPSISSTANGQRLTANDPIGIFDSGVGGLTVLHEFDSPMRLVLYDLRRVR